MSLWQNMLRRLRLRPEPPVSVPVTLYTRTGCHLCDEALEQLRDLARVAQLRPAVELIDIDQVPELVSRYGDKVPVLVIAGRERLWGKINPVLLRRTLEAEAAQIRRAKRKAEESQRPIAPINSPPPLTKGG